MAGAAFRREAIEARGGVLLHSAGGDTQYWPLVDVGPAIAVQEVHTAGGDDGKAAGIFVLRRRWKKTGRPCGPPDLLMSGAGGGPGRFGAPRETEP